MGSDSELESLTFSDVEGDLMKDESSEEEEDSESENDGDVKKVPDQPTVMSMAARMAAVRVEKAKEQAAMRPKFNEDAAGAMEREGKQQPSKPEQKGKAPEKGGKRGPGRPKKTDVAAKKAPASARKEPVVIQNTPPVIEVEDSDDASSSSDSSDSDSSSEEVKKIEVVKPPPPPPEAVRKRKSAPKKRTLAAKAASGQKNVQHDDENDDVPLKKLAKDKRTASLAQKRATLPAKSTDKAGKTTADESTRKEPESIRNTKTNGKKEAASKKPLKKPRASTVSRKLPDQPGGTGRKSEVVPTAHGKASESGQAMDIDSSGADGRDEPEGTQLASQPEVSQKRTGPGGRSIRATEHAAQGKEIRKSTSKRKKVTHEQGKSETTSRGAAEETDLQQPDQVEKKKTGKRRGLKAEGSSKHTASEAQSERKKAEQKEVGKHQNKNDEKREQKSIDKEVQRGREDSDSTQHESQDHEKSKVKGGERGKKAGSARGKKNDEILQKRNLVEPKIINDEGHLKKREGGKGAERRKGKKEIGQGIGLAEEERTRREHDEKVGMRESDHKRDPEKRKRKEVSKQDGSREFATKGKELVEGNEKDVGSGVEEVPVDKGQDKYSTPKRTIGADSGAATAISPKGGKTLTQAAQEAISPSPRRSARKRKHAVNTDRTTTGQWTARKALKLDSVPGAVSKGVTDSPKGKPNGNVAATAVEEDQEFTFTAPARTGNGPVAIAPRTEEGGHDVMDVEVSDSSDDELASPGVVAIDVETPVKGNSDGGSRSNAIKGVVDENGTQKVRQPPQSRDLEMSQGPQSALASFQDHERVVRDPVAESEGPSQFLAPTRERPTSQIPSDPQAEEHGLTMPDGLSRGSLDPPEGARAAPTILREPAVTPVSGDPTAQRLSENPSENPLPVMTDKDEPFQAMMLCQQLQRSFWDFADTQENMIDGFLSLLRRRSNINRSRSGNEFPQAWASPDERQYLRRQKWYAEVNLARLELRRIQEQALEEFARKVSAAQESHVNSLGDFFMRGSQGEGQSEMHDVNAGPGGSLRRASMGFVDSRTGNTLDSSKAIFNADTPRGNVRFSMPVGMVPSSSSDPHVNQFTRTPPVFSIPDVAPQTPIYAEDSSGQRETSNKGRPVTSAALVRDKRGASSIMKGTPTNLNPTFSVENTGNAAIDGTRASLQDVPKPTDGRVSLFPDNIPLTPIRQSAVQVAEANLRGPGSDRQVSQGDDDNSRDARATELANGMLKAAAKVTKSVPSRPRDGDISGKGSKSGKKVAKGKTMQRQGEQGEQLVRLFDNSAVEEWVGDAFSDLKLDCYRSRAILKMCNRPGGLPLSKLVELLPFGRVTLRGRLGMLTSKGYLYATTVTDEKRIGKHKHKSFEVYTTAEAADSLLQDADLAVV